MEKSAAEALIFSFMKLSFIKTYSEAREAAIVSANESFRYALNNSNDVDMKYWHNVAKVLEVGNICFINNTAPTVTT